MQTTFQTYNTQITSILSDYLAVFNQEKENLERLHTQLMDDNKDICSRVNFTGHLTGSGLFFDKSVNSVLLVHHRSLNLWIQPGGHLDPLESPLEGALREFREETKIEDVSLDTWHTKYKIPIDIDTHFIPANPKKQEADHYHHDFLYLISAGDAPGKPEIELNETELKDFKWVNLDELETEEFESKLRRTAKKIKSCILS